MSLTDITQRRVATNGIELNIAEQGADDAPLVLMLHGFLAHARCFAFIAPLLAKKYHLVAFDFSGMGDSESREAYSEELRIQEEQARLPELESRLSELEGQQQLDLAAYQMDGFVHTRPIA